MAIRPALVSDAPAISALMLAEAPLITLRPDGSGAESVLASMEAVALTRNLSSTHYRYWVHETEVGLNGVIGLRDNRHLYQFFVRTAMQRKGIGRQLWEHLVLHIELPAPERITVNASLYAQAAYASYGFQSSGPNQEFHGVAIVPMTYSFSSPT